MRSVRFQPSKKCEKEMGAGAQRERQDESRHHPLLGQGVTKTHGEKCAAFGVHPVFVRRTSGVCSVLLPAISGRLRGGVLRR
jgi:hypothetical protein